jgi:ElaB/YqjD/DUF883 family membrane-anchored ribosome-binding protein
MQRKSDRPGETAQRDFNQPSPYDDAGGDPYAANTLEGKGDQAVNDAKEKAKDAGRKIQEQADAGRESAGEGLGTAAEKIRQKSQEQDGMAAEAGSKIAEGMDQTATYLKEHDTGEMVDDLERYIRQHPMQAVAGAVAAGFVIGRILR